MDGDQKNLQSDTFHFCNETICAAVNWDYNYLGITKTSLDKWTWVWKEEMCPKYYNPIK